MSRREDFDNSLWSDPDFLALSSEARMTYIWSWTNPRCGMAGIYKVAAAQAAFETGLPEDIVRCSLTELGEARFAFYVDNVLWVRSRVKHLRQKTRQIAVAIKNDLRRIADDHPLKREFLTAYAGHSWLSGELSSEARLSLNNPSTDPLVAPDGRPTVLGTGTGTGYGGRGAQRRGRAPEPGPYRPDPWAMAIQAEHFPEFGVSAVEGAAATLRYRRHEPSVEAIRALLVGDAL